MTLTELRAKVEEMYETEAGSGMFTTGYEMACEAVIRLIDEALAEDKS